MVEPVEPVVEPVEPVVEPVEPVTGGEAGSTKKPVFKTLDNVSIPVFNFTTFLGKVSII